MSDLSDLELVAQAMAPTEARTADLPAKSSPKSINRVSEQGKEAGNGSKNDSAKAAPDAEEIPDLSQIPELADLDPSLLASLSLEDRQSLLPLLAALQRANTGLEGGGEDGEEDLGDMAEILKQMDQAGEVADELESKLDRLIRALGEEEEGLKEAVPLAEKAKAVEDKKGEAEKP